MRNATRVDTQGGDVKTPIGRLASALGFARERVDPNAATMQQVDQFLERLERTPFETVRTYAVRPLAPVALNEARRNAQVTADEAGRMDLRLEVAGAIDTFLSRAFDGRPFDPTYISEPLRPEDRARLLKTLVDASLAVVAQDLIDDRTFDQLVGPCGQLVR
jgi:hypothetical protein